MAEGGAGERLRDGVGIGDEGKEDKGEDKGEAMSSSEIGGSSESASAATATSMSTLKSKAGLAGVVQEEKATPEHI
jgi:hypothetical protein